VISLASLLAARTIPWAQARAVHATQAVTDTGATKTLDAACVHVVIVNVGANTAFLRFDGTPGTDGIPLPVNVPFAFDVVGGMDLDFDCASGETATVHIAQLLGE